MRRAFIAIAAAACMLASPADAKKEKPPEEATLGRCLAAISIAQRHNNQWDAPFTMDECAAIAGKAIDDGLALMPNDKDDK
jgi:hypothetical protein